MEAFTPWRLARRGLWGWRRAHAATAAGVAIATAVLVGALVVGDSVRGSLRDLTLQRLGAIDYALAPGRSFRAELADEMQQQNDGARVAPLLLAPASVSVRVDGKTRNASRLTLVGCDERFLAMGAEDWPLQERGVLLTAAVAAELGVVAGDSVLLRTKSASALPADSALGEKADTVASQRLRVTAVLPAEGLARFGLAPTQGAPRNAFVPLAVAQRLIGLEGECTALIIDAETTPTVAPKLADYGLSFDQPRPDVWQLESRELVLTDQVVAAARRAWATLPVTASTTYLADTIRVGDRTIPYSTVAGIEATPAQPSIAPTDNGAIVLNRWAADDLNAKVGDPVTLTYYEPESTHGELREAPPVTLKLSAIVELSDADGESTAANDPRWTPQLEGVTDAESIDNWDLPFELTETIRDQDETYWDDYRTTPKAFVSFALAEKLWGSRWGDVSLLRVAAPEADGADLTQRLLDTIDPADLGFAPLAIRAQGLAASSGSTPFDVLFLLFSMFLIGAALLLIVLLVWLAIDERRREVGLLGAIGFDRRRVRRGQLREMAPVAGLGALVGAAVGVAYAAGLLYLLRTVWVAAVGAPFLRLHVGPLTLVASTVGAWVVAIATIAWAVRSATKTPPRTLLAGGSAQPPSGGAGKSRLATGVALGCATLAGVAAMSGGSLRGEAAAGVFFAVGGLTLVALLATIYRFSRREGANSAGLALPRLAAMNVRRRPGRSLLTIGLVAAASFLLLATSAFRLPPTDAGTGGFDLIAQSDQPLHYDLATADGRRELGFSSDGEAALAGATVYGFRVQDGEDASCRNLYQTKQPRVLGVTPRFAEVADNRPTPMEWADNANPAAPWTVLANRAVAADMPVPVVLDFNTAMYSLKLYGGVGSQFTIRDEVGEEVTVEVAGLLKNSVLQGDLLMGEADFLRLFPSASGYRFFLIAGDDPAALADRLEDTLADYGFDAQSASARLADFLAVQNTYLSTFQALGGLGLALGAIGLAVAQFRNLLERRGELALLRAAGFTKDRLRRLVLLENLTLLAAGLAAGAIAAAATLGPLSAQSDAQLPWLMAIALIAATVAIGLVASRIASGRALSAPLTAALRGE
ncbi:FtsX-like permease family protein [Botrimarina colliarenosi]|uniref:FtsX-like permease family protein n=1 Tax=Botrimarina colliarenosi TaxID=2528001 RepID=A0A5C6AJR1_9BACT|nr:FtsX-like permease family protein [Botrimarina colliarenosi]TWT99646.1 FtsX-like permease family protein [Botrimarina colliarenosi]